MQKVVSRSDLRSDDDSRSSADSELEVEDALKNFEQLEFVQPSHVADQKNGNGDDEELDFQLFAPSKSAESGGEVKEAQKVKLRSPSIDNSNPGFIQPDRDRNYYFANGLSAIEKENVEAAALTGQQILELSKSYRPGSAYEWKVLDLPKSPLSKTLRGANGSAFRRLTDRDDSRGRRRPGKKARIKVRAKQDALKEQQLAGKAASEAKEAAEREKRTKRNREKKVKKKMRDKAKKAPTTEDEQPESPG